MSNWYLTDCSKPADGPDDFAVFAVESEAELRRELKRFRKGDPIIIGLDGPINRGLQIGIGGPIAGIRWGEVPYSGRGGTILAEHPVCDERIDFTSEGDHIAFWPNELMPIERAIEIIVDFYRNQELPDWSSRKDWDPVTKKWHTKPATAKPPLSFDSISIGTNAGSPAAPTTDTHNIPAPAHEDQTS